MNQVFQNVGGARIGRSLFNLSYDKKLTCDMGELVPVLCDEMVPGDIFQIGAQAILRFQPLVAPILHEVNLYVHYFFVPYRLLWTSWEDFITGGADGTLVPTLPRWTPTAPEYAKKSLWDYLGLPTGFVPTGALPLIFPKYAYQFVWNEFFRDESLQAKVTLGDAVPTLYKRAWEKDYFASALLWQQRGTAPAIPITGIGSAVFGANVPVTGNLVWPAVTTNSPTAANFDGVGEAPSDALTKNGLQRGVVSGGLALKAGVHGLDDNVVTIAASPPISIADMRLGFQVQRFLERNARAGARYTEFLRAHFAVSPRDDRLQRPEYIGGMKAPVIFSEVLQTSQTGTTPQGNMAGHGISVDQQYVAKYRAQEFGLILGLMSIMPRPVYQQGINRQWLRTTRYDFYFPEFAHLSEQAIKRCEIFATSVANDNAITFGFCGAYDEMRVKQSMICGDFRDTYDYWHLSRQFASAPLLNASFIECVPRKDCMAAPSEPACLVSFGNIIKALRPMPIIAEPGLIDHG
ncbi:MAG: major capsid protein [Microvirus sp.]|nr:MAG: major capsid protein [Microvirus sp.]